MTDSRELKFKHGKRSDMWWIRFMARHDIFSPRSPEATASVRHDAMQFNAWQSMSMSWKTSFSPKHLEASFAELEYG